MRRTTNRWHEAICEQLRAAEGPIVTDQIWEGMRASGFQHDSRVPRSTLGARIAELVQARKLERVGPKTYRLSEDAS